MRKKLLALMSHSAFIWLENVVFILVVSLLGLVFLALHDAAVSGFHPSFPHR